MEVGEHVTLRGAERTFPNAADERERGPVGMSEVSGVSGGGRW